uniref:uncharacterized protein n=1 Tax=Pristiophorus japonicus TaxID=55135 RepID=UPI00398F29D8
MSSSTFTIESLRAMFATHGLPDIIVSDNESCFTSFEFQEFETQWYPAQLEANPNEAEAMQKKIQTRMSLKRISSNPTFQTNCFSCNKLTVGFKLNFALCGVLPLIPKVYESNSASNAAPEARRWGTGQESADSGSEELRLSPINPLGYNQGAWSSARNRAWSQKANQSAGSGARNWERSQEANHSLGSGAPNGEDAEPGRPIRVLEAARKQSAGDKATRQRPFEMARLAKCLMVVLMAITRVYADDINCPGDPDWRIWNDHCVLITSYIKTWEKARDICKAYRGTELLYLDTVAEKDWLSANVSGVYWTGLNDRANEAIFLWTTNLPLDAALMPYLMNDLLNGDLKDCVQLDTNTGLLTDRPCSEEKQFVCKSIQHMDWFEKRERMGITLRPPYRFESKTTLVAAKITCLQQGTACQGVLETEVPNIFYILDSSAVIIVNPRYSIYVPSVCVSGFPGAKCGMEDEICDCTGILRTSFTEVCGVTVRACQNYCATKMDGTDCSKCIPRCPDNANEVLEKDEAAIITLAKTRIFGGATILTINDFAYLGGFKKVW